MTTKSYLFLRTATWNQQIRTSTTLPASSHLQSWLNETGSLTKRLRGIYGEHLAVQILFHQWKPAFIDECRLLNIPPHRYQLIREVLLHADGQPLILARTLLPEATIRIAHRNLSHLGTRPLGEVIFAYPDLERRTREFAMVDNNAWSQHAAQRFPLKQAIWGRRTVYAIHHQPMLVSEFFLPGWLDSSTSIANDS